MAQTLEYTNELDLETLLTCDELKGLIMESVRESTDQLSSCIVSFSYVAIQRFIAHCKDHRLDPLTMQITEIQDFVDQCLLKELAQEMKNPCQLC